MRELALNELKTVSGGIPFDEMTGWEKYWSSYATGAGMSAGLVSGPFIALGTGVGAAVYYLVYTPLYYIIEGMATTVSCIGSGLYAGGAALGNSVASGAQAIYGTVAG